MICSQLFNLLCEKADDVYGGRLPVHVRCLIDECANVGQIPNLEKLMATIRSREISACLIWQTQSQIKTLYMDNADTIIGNYQKLGHELLYCFVMNSDAHKRNAFDIEKYLDRRERLKPADKFAVVKVK